MKSTDATNSRVVWVSFDVIGLRCLEAASAAGAKVVGVVSLPDLGEENPAGWCEFGGIAGGLSATHIETTDINSASVIREIDRLQADMMFVVGWSQLLREPVLRLVPNGVFGMHPTLLPRHRGRAPIPWAILSGLAKTGVTLFEIVDPSADSGAIVGQEEVLIDQDETAKTLYDKILRTHTALIERFVPLILTGTAPRETQDPRRASSWPKRTPMDGIIDWETRASALYDWIRAQTRPYPGAFTYLHDVKVIIWRARPTATERVERSGSVVELREDGVVVTCGDGAILLEEVELSDSEARVGSDIAAELPLGARLG